MVLVGGTSQSRFIQWVVCRHNFKLCNIEINWIINTIPVRQSVGRASWWKKGKDMHTNSFNGLSFYYIVNYKLLLVTQL